MTQDSKKASMSSTTSLMSFDDIATVVMEAIDGIEPEQLLKVFCVLFPAAAVSDKPDSDGKYKVIWPGEKADHTQKTMP